MRYARSVFGVRLFLVDVCFFALAVAPAQADPLPDCSQDRWGIEDCQIRSTDRLGLVFEKRLTGRRPEPSEYDKATYLHIDAIEVRVLTANGTPVATLTETQIHHTLGAPDAPYIGAPTGRIQLGDLDGDGRDEVVLSIGSGGAHGNPTRSIWRATSDSTHFTRSDETLFGETISRTEDGYIAAEAVGGGWSGSFYKFGQDNKLHLIASVGAQAPSGAGGPLSSCALFKTGDLAKFGFTPDTARNRFCGSVPKSPDLIRVL